MKKAASPILLAVIVVVLFGEALATPNLNQTSNVSIVAVRDYGLVANFYLPKTSGKHPAVIVIGGSEGGIWWADRWGEPLAARGYAVLSLAYFGMEKLPAQLEEIPLEYFKKAIDWVRAHPAVDPKRIAFAGVSRGGGVALLVAATYPEVKAVIAGVPSHVVWQSINNSEERTVKSSLTLGGKPVPFAPYDTSQPFSSLLDLYVRSLQNKVTIEAAIIPVEKIKGPILLVSGKNDKMWPSSLMADRVVERLKNNRFRFPYEHLSYESAAHAITGPPRAPSSASSSPTATTPPSAPATGIREMGGTTEGNALARTDAWAKTISFLDRSLTK